MNYTIAVVGASGLVGQTFLKLLQDNFITPKEIRLFCSAKNADRMIELFGHKHKLRQLDKNCFDGCDFIFLFCPNEVSKTCLKLATNTKAIIIDNSSLNRMKKNIPLVVPEINGNLVKNSKIIANPNCTTAICALPLFAINQKYGIEKINFCTYQAVSGSGKKGIDELIRCENGQNNLFYPHNISKTCIPKIGEFKKWGYSTEELKMIDETRKILNLPNITISATCVRVPVPNCHAISVLVKLKKNFSIQTVKKILTNQNGIMVCDNLKDELYPVATLADNAKEVYVGRIRRCFFEKNELLFFVVADNLMRGAAYNAYQIMNYILKENDSL